MKFKEERMNEVQRRKEGIMHRGLKEWITEKEWRTEGK